MIDVTCRPCTRFNKVSQSKRKKYEDVREVLQDLQDVTLANEDHTEKWKKFPAAQKMIRTGRNNEG